MVVGLRLPEGNFIIELLVRYWNSSRSKPGSDRLQSADSRRKKITMQYAEIPGNSLTGIPSGLGTTGLCMLELKPVTLSCRGV